jgi:hypothetical protein
MSKEAPEQDKVDVPIEEPVAVVDVQPPQGEPAAAIVTEEDAPEPENPDKQDVDVV